MTTKTQTVGRFDRPLIAFWVLAFAIAWGTFAVFSLIARQANVDGGALTLMHMAENWQFNGADVGVPYGAAYLLTWLADFAFSIAAVIMIAATAGTTGLRDLWQRLTRFRFGWPWYGLALLPLLLGRDVVSVIPLFSWPLA